MKMTPTPAVPGLHDVAQHDAGLLDAQGRSRLVQDQQAGAEMDGPGDRDTLPLTTGQRADRLIGIADVDAHVGQLRPG